ncbi:hypothetical protein AB9K35_18025 [Leisingera sp. XS_AS12]|uniref:hypothetical protein n=1 Tax=Leisingera sp. XS_AS12 TaxID=3241294 RepID=UPI0035163B02
MKDNLVESEFFGNFDKDVPEDQQEDVLQRVVEAIWSEEGRYDGAVIIGMEELNVLNREAEGSIVIDGREHYFHVRDGDRAGTEILAWNSGEGLRPEPADPKALVPFQSRVNEALASGQARQFLEQWNADLTPGSERGDALHDLVSNAAYDAFFAPGQGRSHFRNKAEAYGYEIGRQSEARAARKELHLAALAFMPVHRPDDGTASLDLLRRWNEAIDPASGIGSEVQRIREAAADRLSHGTSFHFSLEEGLQLRELGFRPTTPDNARLAREAVLGRCFRLVPIEGFDPEELPKNPMAELLQILDPGLVSDTRVNPVIEADKTLRSACREMARANALEMPERFTDHLATLGFMPVRADAGDPEADCQPAL